MSHYYSVLVITVVVINGLHCTFFTMEGGDSEFANFTLPTLKAFLEVHGQNVSGNMQ